MTKHATKKNDQTIKLKTLTGCFVYTSIYKYIQASGLENFEGNRDLHARHLICFVYLFIVGGNAAFTKYNLFGFTSIVYLPWMQFQIKTLAIRVLAKIKARQY